MAGHSAFGTNLDGIKHVALGNTAIKKIGFFSNNVMDVVWSGASLVSYYDGATLLGQREVDEGQDVLRPSGLTAQNLIPYPYAHGTSVIQGITFTVNADGSVRAQGTSTGVANLILTGQLPLVVGHSYKLVGCPTGGSYDTYQICDENTGWVNDIGEGDTFVADNISQHNVFKIRIASGVTIDKVFKPMLVDATLFPDVTYNDFVLYGMNKTGYTHVGWTGYGGIERFETKVATGEPMSLYALFVPNTLVVAQGSMSTMYNSIYRGWNFTYTSENVNPNYVTGAVVSKVSSTYQALVDTKTFTLNKRYYQTADLQLLFGNDGEATGSCAFDGTHITHSLSASVDTKTFNNISNGNHTITSAIYATGDLKECTIGIGTLTLSNPAKWA